MAAVRGYTLDQVEALAGAHARIARRRLRDDLLIARAAQSTPEGFKQALQGLK